MCDTLIQCKGHIDLSARLEMIANLDAEGFAKTYENACEFAKEYCDYIKKP